MAPVEPSQTNIVRRSGNYNPTIWRPDYIESLRSDYVGEVHTRRIHKLKGEVMTMLEKEEDPLAQLEHIDTLQRLGLSYHFEDKIDNILKGFYCKKSCSINNNSWKINNLYATSLEFRLLRQHEYMIPSDVFTTFKDETTGNFKANMCEDIVGLLSLYEASFHLMKGETILEEARGFAVKHLEKFMENNKDQNDDILCILVSHALELPLHWRMIRLETRWYIDVYGKRQDMNSTWLELATLDFNVVQSTHLEDLKHTSRWWSGTRLGEKCSFARDRLVENYLWSVGVMCEPQYGYFRRMLTKLGALLVVLDDVYDVYGTQEELELFGDAFERWDTNAMENLPDYMKILFLAINNLVHEISFDILKEQGHLIIKCLKKMWADLCKCYMVEARWYHSGYKPTLQEYMENGWGSVGIPGLLVYVYFLLINPITEEAMECLMEYPNIIRHSATIVRLVDDLGTSSVELQRGDVAKSIQCYMHETGASDDEARRHIWFLIDETWKQMNEELVSKSPFSNTFIKACPNMARMAVSTYHHGDDGLGVHQHKETKDKILSLFVNPIPLGTENQDD